MQPPPSERQPGPAGRRRDPRTDVAAVGAVLDLVSAGATLSGLSLVAIAEHAGVSRNSLYRRWKTKDDLYLCVLDAVNQPLPDVTGPDVRDDLVAHLRVLIERTLDRRASAMIRALLAEAGAFPELYRRYFAEIVTPRREVLHAILRRGIADGALRPDLDVVFVNEVLVGPVVVRMSSGTTEDLDAGATAERIVDLLYRGIGTT